MEHITAAGNTEIPTYLVLLGEGFVVDRRILSGDVDMWNAERDGLCLSAASPLELLGLLYLRIKRGQDWTATDSEADAFIERFYPESGDQ